MYVCYIIISKSEFVKVRHTTRMNKLIFCSLLLPVGESIVVHVGDLVVDKDG